MRHTCANLALRRHGPVEVVSKTLGHARVSITLDISRHVLESGRKEQVIDLFDTPPLESRPEIRRHRCNTANCIICKSKNPVLDGVICGTEGQI